MAPTYYGPSSVAAIGQFRKEQEDLGLEAALSRLTKSKAAEGHRGVGFFRDQVVLDHLQIVEVRE